GEDGEGSDSGTIAKTHGRPTGGAGQREHAGRPRRGSGAAVPGHAGPPRGRSWPGAQFCEYLCRRSGCAIPARAGHAAGGGSRGRHHTRNGGGLRCPSTRSARSGRSTREWSKTVSEPTQVGESNGGGPLKRETAGLGNRD